MVPGLICWKSRINEHLYLCFMLQVKSANSRSDSLILFFPHLASDWTKFITVQNGSVTPSIDAHLENWFNLYFRPVPGPVKLCSWWRSKIEHLFGKLPLDVKNPLSLTRTADKHKRWPRWSESWSASLNVSSLVWRKENCSFIPTSLLPALSSRSLPNVHSHCCCHSNRCYLLNLLNLTRFAYFYLLKCS